VLHLAPDAYWQADDLFAQIRTIERLLPSLETFCAEVSSELSGLNVTPVMFRRLGGMWLMHLTHQVSATMDDSTFASPPIRITVPSDSWSHHMALHRSSDYRSQLTALMLSSKSWAKSPDVGVVQIPPLASSLVRKLLERTQHAVNRGSRQVVVSQPYLKISSVKRFSAMHQSRSAMQWNDLSTFDYQPTTPNMGVRLALSDVSQGRNLVETMRRLIPLLLPLAYGEDLARLTADVSRSAQIPKLLFSANGSQMNLPYQVTSALWGAKGTLIASHQHGGHQGLDEIHAGEEYEARTSDVHYSLGWTDTRRNIRPLPAAMPQRSNSVSRHRLLLMSLSKSDVTYRLQPFCLPKHFELCARETRDFLAQLGWPEPAIVRAGNEDLSALRLSAGVKTEGFSVPGSISASASALVVHNYLGVTWLETLAMNVPTVCFIPTGIHKFRAAAQPYADALQKVGILHCSGIEAAKFVNGLNGDPSAWWQSAEVQEAREAFVARYANFSENWLPAWMEEFERLLAE